MGAMTIASVEAVIFDLFGVIVAFDDAIAARRIARPLHPSG
jgi:hypothetical protein